MTEHVFGSIAVLGLGYVGLPLAVELGKKNTVIGFDTNSERVKNLIVAQIAPTKEALMKFSLLRV